MADTSFVQDVVKRAVHFYIVDRVESGGAFPSQRAIAEVWGIPKSTISDWFRDWEAEGKPITRTTVGRRKMIG